MTAPLLNRTTRQILYGSRTTSFRYELFEHDPATGDDNYVGLLDGVQPGGTVSASSARSVKRTLSLQVLDLASAKDGKLRIADVDRTVIRIRPVVKIQDLIEIPLGMFLVVEAPEQWSGTGRVFDVSWHDKSTVLAQDAFPTYFTASAGTPVLQHVAAVVGSAGETITVGDDPTALSQPRTWSPEDSKLTIVNDLLDAIGYNSLHMDGWGNFRATPYVRPQARSTSYEVLTDEAGQRIRRELGDGTDSIYSTEWSRIYDDYKIPNQVTAIQNAEGDAAPLVGVAQNTNPDSRFSIPRRGRTIAMPPVSVEVPDMSGEPDPDAAVVAFLEERAHRTLAAATSQAKVEIDVLPVPVELLDAVMFSSTPAGINSRHTVQGYDLSLAFDGLMSLSLVEVADV